MQAPALVPAWMAEVDIGERQDLGSSAAGHRFLVPILGGHFHGPHLAGRVLPGGTDRQLLRPDGVRVLDALYEMQVEDGTVITVHNRVLIDETGPGEPYARSVLRACAPRGRHEWVSRRILVGTLQSLRPARAAVRVGVYEFV